jgi:ubiquinol-cytochrome c reductase iron-sulfur subunit
MKAKPIDQSRRRFLTTAAGVLGGCGAVCALAPLLSSLVPNQQTVAAGGPVRVDLSALLPGQQLTVLWRGQPVWIIHRTSAMLASLDEPNPLLRDPFSRVNQQPAYAVNSYRSIKPDYLVLIGVCTHLGCSPRYEPSSGFFCPCHGSRFDLAGRVFKQMPAPINFAVPPHRFISDHVLEIGEALHV